MYGEVSGIHTNKKLLTKEGGQYLKKSKQIIYYLWVAISFTLFIVSLIKFFPSYANNEFPLFTDLKWIIFIPAFYGLCGLIIHLINLLIHQTAIKAIMAIIITVISTYLLINIMQFNLKLELIISIIGILFGYIYYAVTELLIKRRIA